MGVRSHERPAHLGLGFRLEGLGGLKVDFWALGSLYLPSSPSLVTSEL